MAVNKKKYGAMATILSWFLAIFFAMAALVFVPEGGASTLSGVFAALFAAVMLPVKRWQAILKQVLKGKLKTVVAIVLVVLTFAVFPNTEADPEVTIPTDPSTQITMPSGSAATVPTLDTNPSTPTSKPTQPIEGSTDPSAPTTEPTQPTSPITTEPSEPITKPTQPTEPGMPEIPAESTFSIHFIDVGQADAALVECDGHYMLIDGGNKADSNLIYAVLKRANVKKLDIVVGTHAHEDHIGGLPGAFQFATADITLCPVKSYNSKAFENFAKYANQKGNGITIPKVGDTYALGSATVTILGLNADDDPNNTSIILRIDYGETSFLFTGDAERAAEQAVLSSGMNLSATVLKIGHHGSDSSTTYPFLREIMPQYAIISVGNDNTYGHPTEDTLSRLRDADVKLFRTDLQGDIFCTSDGKTVSFSVTRNPNADVFGDIGNNSTQLPSEPPATEPTDPAIPTKPSEPEYGGLQILSWPETIGRNETGTVKIKGKANTEYKITVYYKSGPSSASGLEAKTSDADGYVSWSWKVGGRTSPGTFKIVVEGDGEKATVEFTVTQ